LPGYLIAWSVISLFAVLVGSSIIRAFFKGTINLPESDKWYSGFVGPTKGSEYILVFVAITWVLFFSFLLLACVVKGVEYL